MPPVYNAPVPTPSDPTSVVGRRIGAFIVNFVIFAIAMVAGARGIADFKREDIPPTLQGRGIDVGDLIERDNAVSMCFTNEDTVFYATGSNAGLGVFGVPTAVSFLNSVVLA